MESKKDEFIKIAKLCSLTYFNQEFMDKSYKNIHKIEENDNRFIIKNCIKNPILYSSDNDCQVYIYEYIDTIYVCFRGTDSYQDAKKNLKINLDYFILPNFENGFFPSVHKGFLEQFNSVKDFICRNLNKNKKIIFCGHSLGGALAALASLYFSYLYNSLEFKCITFGSPRVGNYLFSRLFNYRVKTCYRFINDKDPVPNLLNFWIYEHTKGYYLLNDNKNVYNLNWYEWFEEKLKYYLGYGCEMLEDHSCDSYISDLRNNTCSGMN
tara:strand:- start:475 stop:1275 length:801 start_codon:yes stop_codon:yes gene_type:complete